MHAEICTKRQWDAQESLARLIRDLEAEARYGAATRCRAVLSQMLSGDVAGALGLSGVISDADTSAHSGTAQIFAGLTLGSQSSLDERLQEYD